MPRHATRSRQRICLCYARIMREAAVYVYRSDDQICPARYVGVDMMMPRLRHAPSHVASAREDERD